MLDKHSTPNLLALALVLSSALFDEPLAGIVRTTGLFALSGALTNWLAVHMLFERVPGLYGSGVIVLHFEEFKTGILALVQRELLSAEKIERLLAEQPAAASDSSGKTSLPVDLAALLHQVDLDAAFDQLVITIRESSFGGMLGMFGGEAALEPLRQPFRNRMRRFLDDAARSPRLAAAIRQQLKGQASSERFIARLDRVLRARLDELTPEMVRDLMQQMIRQHLGWLVVWGGVFGGLIGLLSSAFGWLG